MESFAHIIYTVERGRAIITLNRPERRNAMSLLTFKELQAALWEADDDQAVHAIIHKGAGKDFSFGCDLSQMSSPSASIRTRQRPTATAASTPTC